MSDNVDLTHADQVVIRVRLSLRHPLVVTFRVVVVLQGFQSELFEKVQKLLIIVLGWHLLDLGVEQVYLLGVEVRDKVLNSTIHNPDHFFMLAQLTLPYQVNVLFRQPLLFGQELNDSTASLHYFQMCVFPEHNVNDLFLQQPVLEYLRREPLRSPLRLLSEALHLIVPLCCCCNIVVAAVLYVSAVTLHNVVGFYLLSMLDLLYQRLYLRDALQSLLQISGLKEP